MAYEAPGVAGDRRRPGLFVPALQGEVFGRRTASTAVRFGRVVRCAARTRRADVRHRSRAWHVLKWVGLAISVLLALPYALSGRRLQWTQLEGGRSIRMHNGYIQYGWTSGGVRHGRPFYREGQRFRVSRVPFWPVLLWPPVQVFGTSPRAIRVMTWVPFLVVMTPTAFLWYRDCLTPPGHCQDCGYDLTGNVSGRCPECGEQIHTRSS